MVLCTRVQDLQKDNLSCIIHKSDSTLPTVSLMPRVAIDKQSLTGIFQTESQMSPTRDVSEWTLFCLWQRMSRLIS